MPAGINDLILTGYHGNANLGMAPPGFDREDLNFDISSYIWRN